MSQLPSRTLGSSSLEVSLLSLGSWRTYERIPRDQAVSVMRAAREAGIAFLDDARYDDETGSAPMRTGWSEVVFGELFRAVGWARDEVVVANKLWWEFWPDQDPAAELGASLGRMRFDHVDVIYSMPPPEGLPLDEAIGSIVALLETGMARAWGIGNWEASRLADAAEICGRNGWPLPCAAQLPYSLVRRDWVEGEQMATLLAGGHTGLVASFSLAGGVLSGKYLRGERGRAADGTTAPPPETLAAAEKLDALAGEWGIPAARLALAFPLRHPYLASLLFGATSAEQVAENVAAVGVAESLDNDQWARLAAVGR